MIQHCFDSPQIFHRWSVVAAPNHGRQIDNDRHLKSSSNLSGQLQSSKIWFVKKNKASGTDYQQCFMSLNNQGFIWQKKAVTFSPIWKAKSIRIRLRIKKVGPIPCLNPSQFSLYDSLTNKSPQITPCRVKKEMIKVE